MNLINYILVIIILTPFAIFLANGIFYQILFPWMVSVDSPVLIKKESLYRMKVHAIVLLLIISFYYLFTLYENIASSPSDIFFWWRVVLILEAIMAILLLFTYSKKFKRLHGSNKNTGERDDDRNKNIKITMAPPGIGESYINNFIKKIESVEVCPKCKSRAIGFNSETFECFSCDNKWVE